MSCSGKGGGLPAAAAAGAASPGPCENDCANHMYRGWMGCRYRAQEEQSACRQGLGASSGGSLAAAALSAAPHHKACALDQLRRYCAAGAQASSRGGPPQGGCLWFRDHPSSQPRLAAVPRTTSNYRIAGLPPNCQGAPRQRCRRQRWAGRAGAHLACRWQYLLQEVYSKNYCTEAPESCLFRNEFIR